MNSLLIFIAISIAMGFFWRFADKYPALRIVGTIAVVGILWYVMIYDTPSNRAHRTFNNTVEKNQNKMEQKFQPEKYANRQPEGWDAVVEGFNRGILKIKVATGIEKPVSKKNSKP